MATERQAERIAIESMIHCRNAAGEQWRVLRWRRQLDDAAAGEAARWESVGPSVFTLLDASAVIQISGSALQIVATGMVLNVVEPTDVSAVPRREAPLAQRAGRRGAAAIPA